MCRELAFSGAVFGPYCVIIIVYSLQCGKKRLIVQKEWKRLTRMPLWNLVFWVSFAGVVVYEVVSVVRSYLETGRLGDVFVPHVDALVLVVLTAAALLELKKRHRHIENSERTLQAMIDNIPYVVWMKDKQGRFVSANKELQNAAGTASVEEVVGKTDFDLWPEAIARHYLHDDEEVMRTKQTKELEELMETDGKHFWMHTFKTPVLDAEGKVIGTVGFSRDITVKKEEEYKLQRFIDLQKDIVILTDGEVLDFANKALLDFFGYETLEAFKKDYQCVCERFVEHENFFHLGKVAPEDAHWIESLQHLKPESRIVSMINCHSEPHAFTVSISTFDTPGLYVVSFTDISGTVIETLNLKQRVLHDKLTGAYNRDYFEHYYSINIERFEKLRKQSAVIFFDIDHFKRVNDTHGHNVGDLVLCGLVDVVKRSSRDDDFLVRWGGEEFLLLAPVETAENAEVLAEHLRKALEAHEFPTVGRVTCSFGVTLCRPGESIVDTVERADRALYKAKSLGRNRVVYEA